MLLRSSVQVGPVALSRADSAVDQFRELVSQRLALPVPQFQSRWLSGQLSAFAHSEGFSDLESLIEKLDRESVCSSLWSSVLHEVTVHETYWMRNSGPLLKAIQSFGHGIPTLRILSLGCAYGQEAYCAYLMARAAHPYADITVEGIDLSSVCVRHAERGRFKVGEDFEGIRRYLAEGDGVEEGGFYAFAPSVRDRLRFSQGNLINPYVAKQSAFDLILCQNCLTYYDPDTRSEVAQNLVNSLDVGCLLVFAGAELMGSRPSGTVPLSEEWSQILVKGF